MEYLDFGTNTQNWGANGYEVCACKLVCYAARADCGSSPGELTRYKPVKEFTGILQFRRSSQIQPVGSSLLGEGFEARQSGAPDALPSGIQLDWLNERSFLLHLVAK